MGTVVKYDFYTNLDEIMRFKYLFIIILFTCSRVMQGQDVIRTQILKDNIKTLQVKTNGNPLAVPVIELNTDDVLTISFDEMSHEGRSFSYEIKHCNADWTESTLSTAEFLQGFSRGYIDDYALSINTTFLFTNYRFSLPNDDVKFNVSGNYAVNIFEDNERDNPVACLRFYVVDPKVEIRPKVRGNTDAEIYGSLQQLDFDVITENYKIQDAHSELKAVVIQNGRLDNAVTDLKPTYYSHNKFSFVNNRKLIFEGGNEYHRIDFSSIYNYDERISEIKFVRPHYEVFVETHYPNTSASYQTDFDVNGKFVINYQNGFDSDLEADYMYVHIFLPMEKQLENGEIYLGGHWNYNQMNDGSRMNYDSYNKLYYKTLLLKQGGYNYQFWYFSEQADKVFVKPIDGSYWQTQNEYGVFIYHRPWGGRYDQLIGVKVL